MNLLLGKSRLSKWLKTIVINNDIFKVLENIQDKNSLNVDFKQTLV